MNKAKRQEQILALLKEDSTVSVAQLCTHFAVSEMTIRRDLGDLDRQGLLRRVHGGAIHGTGRSYEPPYRIRSEENSSFKQQIGEKAASFIFDGDSIALDVGTTTLEIVAALTERRNLTIVTASLPIANEIANRFSLNSDVRLILTGGILRAGELSMIGEFAQDMYRRLHVDKAFIGVGGISLTGGLTEYNMEDAFVKKALLSTARKKYVVADGSKLGQTSFTSFGELTSVDTIITDETAPADVVEAIRNQGVEVIAAG